MSRNDKSRYVYGINIFSNFTCSNLVLQRLIMGPEDIDIEDWTPDFTEKIDEII